MVEKLTHDKFNKGDLLEVKLKNGAFKCIVVETLNGGFIGKVLSKDQGIGTASWLRYGMNKDFRIQAMNECLAIKRLAEATKSSAKSTLELNESIQKSDLTYYETKVNKKTYVTFCESADGYGGWSIHDYQSSKTALKESYLNMQLSKLQSQAK